MGDKGYTNQEGTVDIRAPGSHYLWAGECVTAGAVTRPMGAMSSSRCRDPNDPYGFKIFSRFRAAPDDISFDVLAPKWKVRKFQDRLIRCAHDIRKRWSKCLQMANLESWQYIEDFLDAYIEQQADSGGIIEISGTGADVIETFSIKAGCVDYLWRILPARIGEAQTTLNINAVRFCSPPSCGQCGDVNDGCQQFRAVTDSGPTYLDTPKLIVASRDIDGWAFTYVVNDIDPFNAGLEHADDLDCLNYGANGRVMVVSNAAGAMAYSDDGGANWIEVPLTVTGEPNAIYALDWAHIYIVGDLGFVYKSTDGGVTWEVVDTPATLNENLSDVHAFGDLVAVVGANNEFGYSQDGGDTWTVIAGPTPGVTLNVVRCLSDREILVGTNDGGIYRTTDNGTTWETVEDFAARLGAAASIAAWDFCGCRGDKGLVAVNSAAVGYVFRTIDHAMTFQVLRDDSGVEKAMPTNIGLNDIACCDPNVFVAVGDAQGGSGYMALIK